VISLAAELRRLDFVPDLLRTSDASRAHQTARILAGLIDYPLSRIAVEASLYLADREFLFRSIRETPADAHHLLLVGHNPGLSELWDLLSDHPGAGLPTCGLAEFEIESNDWGSIMPGTARLLCFRGAAPGSR
jgi:phosphohistidine phosphatase